MNRLFQVVLLVVGALAMSVSMAGEDAMKDCQEIRAWYDGVDFVHPPTAFSKDEDYRAKHGIYPMSNRSSDGEPTCSYWGVGEKSDPQTEAKPVIDTSGNTATTAGVPVYHIECALLDGTPVDCG